VNLISGFKTGYPFFSLYNIAELAAKTSNESFRILKNHNLLEYQLLAYQQVRHVKTKRTSFKRKTDKRQLKYDLKGLENLLNQSVRFKNAVQAKASPDYT
jgi:hypothetical protein